jgi:DNA-binding NarL/FixJ family response regulator
LLVICHDGNENLKVTAMIDHPSSRNTPESPLVQVLIVDDMARVREELRQLLQLSGMVQIVGEAGDGLEAVRLAGELSPDVVVMDLEMPVMDGFEATSQIKSSQPEVWVVILSIHNGGEARERALRAGADRFVIKGASYQTLLKAILRGSDISDTIDLE